MNEVRVKNYFEKTAREFDDIYDNRGSILVRLVNKVFRKGMYERATLAIQRCGDVQTKTILDIGCGSGRISLALARGGAKVTGIDYSASMIELAKNYSNKSEVDIKVDFLCCDFMEDFTTDEPFDITLALGVFDYIRDPMPFLEKMRDVTKEKMIASYPAKFAVQTPIRKLWLHTRNCPVYFYTENGLKAMYERLGIRPYNITISKLPLNARIHSGYLVEATR